MKGRRFEPRVDILPKAQRRLWPELAHTPAHFTLYGGTALALRLAHRQSVDFDFFSTEAISGTKLLEEIDYLQGAKVRQLEPDTLTCSVHRAGAVRLSYFGGLSIGRVDPVEVADGPKIKVASLRDIAGTKMSVVTQRAEAKDYIDIHALLTQAHLPLAEMLSCARAIYGAGFDPLHSLKALAYHDDPALAPLEPGLKRDLLVAIRATDVAHLPSIKAVRARKAKR
jgi:hypothetical protein